MPTEESEELGGEGEAGSEPVKSGMAALRDLHDYAKAGADMADEHIARVEHTKVLKGMMAAKSAMTKLCNGARAMHAETYKDEEPLEGMEEEGMGEVGGETAETKEPAKTPAKEEEGKHDDEEEKPKKPTEKSATASSATSAPAVTNKSLTPDERTLARLEEEERRLKDEVVNLMLGN